jgi:hypothetical protein
VVTSGVGRSPDTISSGMLCVFVLIKIMALPAKFTGPVDRDQSFIGVADAEFVHTPGLMFRTANDSGAELCRHQRTRVILHILLISCNVTTAAGLGLFDYFGRCLSLPAMFSSKIRLISATVAGFAIRL